MLTNHSLEHFDVFDEELLRLQQPWRLGLQKDPSYSTYWFENVDNLYWRKFVWIHPYYPYISCIAYLITIFGIQAFMKNHSPLKLKTPLSIWNWGLGTFSMLGFYRMAQEMGPLIFSSNNGLHKSICGTDAHYLPAAYWGWLFVLSKYIELGDTVFMVLKKQPVLVLQWYHHGVSVITGWVLYSWQESIIRWYSMMNYGVHSFMYPYFALKGMGVKVPEIFAMSITTLQVSQMVAGVAFNVYTVYLWGTGGSCNRNPNSVAFSLFTYFSLCVMFVQFFVSKYISKTRRRNKVE